MKLCFSAAATALVLVTALGLAMPAPEAEPAGDVIRIDTDALAERDESPKYIYPRSPSISVGPRAKKKKKY